MDQPDLYSVDIPDEAFGTPCGGNIGGSLESCVDSAEIPGQPGAVALRDTKLGAASPELRFSAAEMTAFVASYAATQGTSA
jgi:hypothetical protein